LSRYPIDMNRTFVSLGSGLAFLGVALGAFGTHGLRDRLSSSSLQIWQTAVQYQLIHALGLILIGLIAAHSDERLIRLSGWLLYYGVLIFSGSLYILAVTGIGWFGAITPIGGVCFLSGWGSLAWTASRRPRTS